MTVQAGAEGGCWDGSICAIIGFAGPPNTGNELITPTTGFSEDNTCVMARVMSYSNDRSRLGSRNWNRHALIPPCVDGQNRDKNYRHPITAALTQ